MAKSALELAVNTGQWDAGLKKAQQSLNNFTEASGGLQQALQKDSENIQKFVRMMGNFESTAKTAKGQMNDYKSAIEQLTMQYNRLTGAQKESFGSSYTATIDQLKVKYQAVNKELQEMTRSLNDMPTLGTEGGIFSKMGDKLGGAMSVFAGNLMTKATMEVANLGSEMAEMVKQGVEMAKAGEGIRVAFERLGNGKILDGLREATHGTVTDIELMKAAVKFNDFKLPIEELGTMLAFAQQKAKDTGQSVDYMVDSIVTGLGRKSLMILDNLGLSAAEIKDKMAETGDMTKAVGAIIREQMQKAGDYVETAADRAAQANVDLQNKLEELGRKFLPVQEASNQLWTSMKIGILDIVGGPLARLLNGLTEAGRLRNQMNDMAGGNSSSETEKQLNFLRKTSPANRQQRYDKQLGIYTQQENAAWREVNSLKGQRENFRKERLKSGARDDDWTVYADFDKRIAEAERKAKAWQNFRADYIRGAKELIKPVEVDVKTDNAEKNVDSLRVKLAELEAQRKKAIKTGDQDLAKNLTKQITQTKSDIKALDPNALKTTTTHTLTKPEQADAKYVQAQKDYEQSLQQAALEVKAGTINSAEAKKKELQAAETLWKSIGDAREVYDSPKLKDAQANVEAKIVALGPEVDKAIEAQKESEKAARELANAQKKLTDAQNELADAQASGDLKKIYAAEKKVETAQVQVDARTSTSTGEQKAVEIPVTISNLDAVKQKMTEEMATTPVGDSLLQNMQEAFSDASAIGAIFSTAVKNGIDTATFDTSGIMQKLLNGEDIPDDTIQGFVQTLNEKLVEAFGEDGAAKLKVVFDVDDKQIKNLSKTTTEEAQNTQKAWGLAAQSVNNMGNALNAIDDPSAKAAGTVIKAIADIALGFAQASKAVDTTASGWGWLAWLAAGTAAMATTISTVHSLTGFANGGIVQGKSYSGDNVGPVMLDAGEVVLNHAQSAQLAQELEGGRVEGMSGTPYVTGEYIYLGLNNYLKGAGLGQIVTAQ